LTVLDKYLKNKETLCHNSCIEGILNEHVHDVTHLRQYVTSAVMFAKTKSSSNERVIICEDNSVICESKDNSIFFNIYSFTKPKHEVIHVQHSIKKRAN